MTKFMNLPIEMKKNLGWFLLLTFALPGISQLMPESWARNPLVRVLKVSDAAAAELPVVQNGSTVLANGSSTTSVTISAVNTSRSFLVFNIRLNDGSPANGEVTGQISSSTTITFQRIGTIGDVGIEWSVAEFASGVTVQRGSTPMTTTTVNVPITSVDLSKSFPIVSQRVGGTTYSWDDFIRAKLSSSTNLELSVGNARPPEHTVEWQVVQYDDASVQTGDVTFLATDSSKTASVSAIDVSKSWLVYSYENYDNSGTPISEKLLRGVIDSPTNLIFNRDAAGVAVDLTWYLIEFNDDVVVQHANANFPNSTLLQDVSISAIDPLRSIAIGGYLQTGGKSPYSTSDNPGVAWFTFDFTSATNLRIQRNFAAATADVGWFTVYWPPTWDVSGTVFEDPDFSGAATNWDGGIGDVGLANVDVELYTNADVYLTSVTTDAGGNFVFTDLVDGNYKVRVRSATIGDADTPPASGYNATVPGTWPYALPEMTWGHGDALIGGQDHTVDDTATGDNAGPGDTYLNVTVSGVGVTGVNFGFNYELIVNEDDDANADNVRSKQGSLRQFIKNSNALAGTNKSWFQIPGL